MSIPYSSGHSFLHSWRNLRLEFIHCVNPLLIGALISTDNCKRFFSSGSNVSIPYSSGHSFLLHQLVKMKKVRSVSIPYSSGHSFLLNQIPGEVLLPRCVNPLLIGALISTDDVYAALMRTYYCVNPLLIGALISTLTLKIA